MSVRVKITGTGDRQHFHVLPDHFLIQILAGRAYIRKDLSNYALIGSAGHPDIYHLADVGLGLGKACPVADPACQKPIRRDRTLKAFQRK